jgi:hypothetical protein
MELIGCESQKTRDSFTKGQIIEYAPIVLKGSVTEEALLISSEVLQRDFLTKQQGFIKRILVKKTDKEYVDIVIWDNKENADKAIENSMQSKACENYFSCMQNLDASGVLHFEVLAEYDN